MWVFFLSLLMGAGVAGIAGGKSDAAPGKSDAAPGKSKTDVLDTSPEVVIPDDDTMPDMDHAGDDTMPDMDHAGGDTMPDMDHGGDDTMPDMDHAGGDTMPDMDHGGDDTMPDMDHSGHDMDPIALPETAEEIAAFVDAVRQSDETHVHDMASSKAGEHMAAMDLVPRDEATHIAIAHGDWDDPSNWHNGEVPGDDAKVVIPDGVHMTYDHVDDARLFTLRIDGELDFASDVDSQLIVDTLVVTPGGQLTIGTQENPIDADVSVDIIFANNGPIDTDWDPMLLSHGMVAHGTVEIHGAEKDSHDKVVDDPQAGDTWVDFAEAPEGWQVGDTIVIAGTHYEGYYNYHADRGFSPPEDEERVISQIEGNRVIFEDPLEFDHDTPREDLKTSVANYTRNVSFETENAETAEIYERAHVMFMHNDDVDVRYAEFHELGRTDKSEDARNVDEFEQIEFDSNVKGRYSFHFHRAGMDDIENPGMAVGNAVYGSPGWGFVHHDSNAVLDNNATFNTFGAGYVAESGNETGAWTDNIAIFAQGMYWGDPKLVHGIEGLENFDLGRSGDGFWFQSRMVEATDNIAASVNNGFVYFGRGIEGEAGVMRFDAEVSPISGAFYEADDIRPAKHPILSFDDNEAFAANRGLYVLKTMPIQQHDVRTVLEDFTAWNIAKIGADLTYTGHYTLKNFDVIGKEATELSGAAQEGIHFGANATDMTIIDSTVENFKVGMNLEKTLVSFWTGTPTEEDTDYIIVNPTFHNVDKHYENYDPEFDTILATEDVPYLKPDIVLDGPLNYNVDLKAGIPISGTKTDSLGETDFPNEADSYNLGFSQSVSALEKAGYYTTSDGQDYFMLDIYFGDRLTGDIYTETHPVFIGEGTPISTNSVYSDVPFNGVQDLGGPDDPTVDSAILWATLTDGQPVLTEEALAMEEEDNALEEAI